MVCEREDERGGGRMRGGGGGYCRRWERVEMA